jgi:hypothetical protein
VARDQVSYLLVDQASLELDVALKADLCVKGIVVHIFMMLIITLEILIIIVF